MPREEGFEAIGRFKIFNACLHHYVEPPTQAFSKMLGQSIPIK